MRKPALELVIFDCDGVLVDSERIANTNLAEMITELGYKTSGPECQKLFMGRTLEDVQSQVEKLVGRQLPDDWTDQVRDRDFEAFEKGVPAVEGVAAVLDHLDRVGIPYCVGSSGKYAKMNKTLGSAGLLPRLKDKLFSAQDCKRGKPAPDIFLLAAKKMGHRPENCLVVEDSLPGVRAAKAAGMRVFAYVEDPACDKSAMAEEGGILFDQMSDLPALLRAIE